MALPKDEFEFQVLLRKEYERGVEDADRTACQIYMASYGMSLKSGEISKLLLNRATDTQRSAPLLNELGDAIEEKLDVYIIPNEGFIKVVVGNMKINGFESVFTTTVDTIFQVQEAIAECRTKLSRGNDVKNGSDPKRIGATLPKKA